MAPVAADTVLLGVDTPVQAGGEIPASYRDMFGAVHETDFERLEDLGLIDHGDTSAEADPLAGLTKKELIALVETDGLEVDVKQNVEPLRAAVRAAQAAKAEEGETPPGQDPAASKAALDASKAEQRPLTPDELAVLTDEDFATAVAFTTAAYRELEPPPDGADRATLTAWILARRDEWLAANPAP